MEKVKFKNDLPRRINEIKIINKNISGLNNLEDFTIEFWVELNNLNTNMNVIDFGKERYKYHCRLPYWFPKGKFYHLYYIWMKKRLIARYINGIQITKENWPEILNMIFRPIKNWGLIAQLNLFSSIK